MRRLPSAGLLAALLTTGCITIVNPAPPTTPAPSAPEGAAASPVASAAPAAPAPGAARATTVVTGRLLGPAGMVAAGGGNAVPEGTANILAGGMVAAGGGNIVGNAGGNIVGNAGGNIVAAGGLNFVLRQAEAEAPVAGAWVQLADAGGQPYPAIPAVKTDAEGRFELKDVPVDLTFVVQGHVKPAGGKETRLLSIVQPSVAGASTELTAASTCVTAAVLDGQGGVLGKVDPGRFARAVAATAQARAAAGWPDLADRAAVMDLMAALSKDVAEVRDSLDAVRTDLKELRGDMAAMRAELERLRQAMQQGAATPAPTPAPTTSPAATPTPSVEPTPRATPRPTPTPEPSPEVEVPRGWMLMRADGAGGAPTQVAQAVYLGGDALSLERVLAQLDAYEDEPVGDFELAVYLGYAETSEPDGDPIATLDVDGPDVDPYEEGIHQNWRLDDPVAIEAGHDYLVVVLKMTSGSVLVNMDDADDWEDADPDPKARVRTKGSSRWTELAGSSPWTSFSFDGNYAPN